MIASTDFEARRSLEIRVLVNLSLCSKKMPLSKNRLLSLQFQGKKKGFYRSRWIFLFSITIKFWHIRHLLNNMQLRAFYWLETRANLIKKWLITTPHKTICSIDGQQFSLRAKVGQLSNTQRTILRKRLLTKSRRWKRPVTSRQWCSSKISKKLW